MATLVGNDPKTRRIITTGNTEIDNKMGGGIPGGSLTLVEGQSDAGKSVVTQQLMWGALDSGCTASLYTTESTVRSLLRQMESLNLDVSDYFLLRRLNIYRLAPAGNSDDACQLLASLPQTLAARSSDDLMVIDSLTSYISHAGEREVFNFFSSCKQRCDEGQTLIVVVHSFALSQETLIRLRSMCDAHLHLRLETVGDQLVKMLEVAKVRGAERSTGNIISFDVDPGLGMRIIPISRAKA